MMKAFMDEDFLLQTETAKRLYHEHAVKMPIIDYHCHISPREIAEDRCFRNITEVWLGGTIINGVSFGPTVLRRNTSPVINRRHVRSSKNLLRLCRGLLATRYITGRTLNLSATLAVIRH